MDVERLISFLAAHFPPLYLTSYENPLGNVLASLREGFGLVTNYAKNDVEESPQFSHSYIVFKTKDGVMPIIVLRTKESLIHDSKPGGGQ